MRRVHGIRREKTLERLSAEDSQATGDIAADPAVLVSDQRNAGKQRQLSLDIATAIRDSGSGTYKEARSRSDVAGVGRKFKEGSCIGKPASVGFSFS